ncbi:MAG: hypothetical protein FJ115_00095 [Deltaproteobacteria bacterium]|nr:hypothetical protein [Deltaproteobacteria bacterium]MBM4321929.1 hypothetical protein [Deltaproteobacteria bacterium]
MELLYQRRAQGDRKAILIYGFDSLDRLKKMWGKEIFEASGIFYIKLPSSLDEIKSALNQAMRYEEPGLESAADEGVRKQFLIEKIREFKHGFDNLWMSMETSLNLIKRFLPKRPLDNATIRKKLNISSIKKRVAQSGHLLDLINQVDLSRSEDLRKLFKEIMKDLGHIEKDKVSEEQLLMSFSECIQRIRQVSEILSEAKELVKGE